MALASGITVAWNFYSSDSWGPSDERFRVTNSLVKAKGVWRRDILRLSPRHVELRFEPNVQGSEQAVRSVVRSLPRRDAK
jgi:hypothetical protein